MENKLITTNSLWYKIKKFIKNLFNKSKSYSNDREVAKAAFNSQNTNIRINSNLNEKFNKEKNNQELADKLLCCEIGPYELNDIEVDEMTQYFTKEINQIDNEILRIKQNIIDMKQKIANLQ